MNVSEKIKELGLFNVRLIAVSQEHVHLVWSCSVQPLERAPFGCQWFEAECLAVTAL